MGEIIRRAHVMKSPKGEWPAAAAGATIVVVGPNEFSDDRHAVHQPIMAVLKPAEDWKDADEIRAIRLVKERLKEAGETVRKMESPPELRSLMGGNGSWPAIRHERNDMALWKPRRVKIRPTAKEMAGLDEVLGWFALVKPEAKPVVFAQMVGISFRKLALMHPQGRGRTALKRDFEASIVEILCGLITKNTTR